MHAGKVTQCCHRRIEHKESRGAIIDSTLFALARRGIQPSCTASICNHAVDYDAAAECCAADVGTQADELAVEFRPHSSACHSAGAAGGAVVNHDALTGCWTVCKPQRTGSEPSYLMHARQRTLARRTRASTVTSAIAVGEKVIMRKPGMPHHRCIAGCP